jgi:hypothetical protein
MPLRRRRRSRSGSLLLVGVGALAGLALGALIAERAGGVDGLLRGGKGGTRLPRRDGWRSEERDTDEFRSDAEADEELAPDAISHMHVRGSRGDIETTAEFEVLEALEERVLEAFRNDLILAERAIDIGAIDAGTIELTGWVRASSEIGHALTLARGVPGVEAVIDRLAVRGTETSRDHSTMNYANTEMNFGAMGQENTL